MSGVGDGARVYSGGQVQGRVQQDWGVFEEKGGG